MKILSRLKFPLALISLIMILIQIYMALVYAPSEKYMGDVQRIMYFHVPGAFVAFLAFGVVFLSGIIYLSSGKKLWDYLAVSSAEIGVIFTTIVLITGSFWARPVWNAWWVWDDPRLVTSLILWFIYCAYLVLRTSIQDDDRMRKITAVFGIVGFLDVPLVYYSVKWWRTIHPNVIDQEGFHMPTEMMQTLSFSIVTYLIVFVTLLMYRFFTQFQLETLEEMKNKKMIYIQEE